MSGVMPAAAPSSALPFARLVMDARLNPRANSKGLSEGPAVAYYTHRHALDSERVAPQIDLDRLELGVLGLEQHRVAAPAQALDRHLVAQARDHDLAAARFGRAVHGKQV